jgi:hypothetical protein
LLGTSGTVTGGLATFSVSGLNLGANQTITAVYSGQTGFFNTSTGTLTPYTVNQAGTTTSVSASPSSGLVYGQPVTFTATVLVSAPSGAAQVDGGSVNFYDGTAVPANLLGNATILGTVATLSSSNFNFPLRGGSNQTITAVYTGDTDFATSTGTLTNYSVAAAGTTTTVSASTGTSSVFGTPVTINVTVSSTAGAANGGTVNIYIPSQINPVGSGTVSAGTAAILLTPTALPQGTYTISAQYVGNNDFAASSGTLPGYTVNAAFTHTAISTSANPSGVGVPVTISATVTDINAGSTATPTGSVAFYDGPTSGTPIGSGSVNSSGVATFTTSSLSLGQHTLNAVYTDTTDNNFQGSTAAPFTQTVANPTTTTIAPPSTTLTYGQTTSYTVTVTSGSGTPSGSVALTINGVQQAGTQSLNGSGQATLTVPVLDAGTYAIGAVYAGQAPSFAGSQTTTTASLTITALATGITVSASPNPAAYGQAVTLTAAVTASFGTPNSGTVNFYDGTITPAHLLGTANVSSGLANLALTTPLPIGSSHINAVYSGSTANSDYVGSTSPATFVETVTKAKPTVTIVPSATSGYYGQAVTFTTTVNGGIGTPTGLVAFFVDGVLKAEIAVTNGQAKYKVANLAVGGHSIFSEYLGDTHYSATVSAHVGYTAMYSTTVQYIVPTPSSLSTAPNAAFNIVVMAYNSESQAASNVPAATVKILSESVAGATLGGSHTANFASNGKATFTLSLNVVANYVLQITVGNLTTNVTVSVTNTPGRLP